MPDWIQQLNNELADVAARVRRGIVQVRNGPGGGTGIVVRPDGLIVTNAHVVQRRYPHVLLADGRSLRAHVVDYDKRSDLAALRVEADDLPAVPFGDSKHARPGTLVQAVGHPWGLVGAATTGVLVSHEASWLGQPLAQADWLVADLHLGPGNSGGPLVDIAGRVLGINTMLVGGGLGVAVPAHRVQAFLRREALPTML